MDERRRVLIVDDDETIRGFLIDLLADEGYETRVACNGAEGLEILHGWRPDAIMLDLMMPVMDGWSFRAAQRALPGAADVPVIVLSAGRDLADSVTDFAPAACLAKPFDLVPLLDTLERLTGAPMAAGPAHSPASGGAVLAADAQLD